MEINFKPVELKDIEILLELMSEFYLHEKLNFNKDTLKPSLDKLINDEKIGEIRRITSGEDTVGYFILTFIYSLEYGGKNALLDEFYIRENFRGKGIGKLTLSFIDEFCKEKNIQAIHLQVKKFNPMARKLYASVGFIEVDRTFMTKIF